MESFFPSSSAYRVNVKADGIPLDECSYFSAGSSIKPYFEESVSKDPDVTALMVFIKDSANEIAGMKVLYVPDGNAESANEYFLPDNYIAGDEFIIPVKSLDGYLPSFPIPKDLPMGSYSIVMQVMRDKNILFKTERPFYFLENALFSYNGIDLNLHGISNNPQLVSKGLTVMLEAKLDIDEKLDPYIVWYNGRRLLSEGYLSDGASRLFWKTPDQSGFYSLRAEVFPVKEENAAGFNNEISLLVSSITMDLNLVSEHIPELMHWYIFDGNLHDYVFEVSAAGSSARTSGAFASFREQRALRPAGGSRPLWMAANGTYGLAAGYRNRYEFPRVLSPYFGEWQAMFRFKPVDEGEIFNVLFDSSRNVSMKLSIEDNKFILSLASRDKNVSAVFEPPLYAGTASGGRMETIADSFLTLGIFFSVQPNIISARVNYYGDSFFHGGVNGDTIQLEEQINGTFQFFIGDDGGDEPAHTEQESAVSVLWNEFALYAAALEDIIHTLNNHRYIADLIEQQE